MNRKFLAQVYLFMTLGIFVTAFVIGYLSTNTQLLLAAQRLWWLILIIQLVFVGGLTASYQKSSTFGAFMLYLILCAINGLLISPTVLYYDFETVSAALSATMITFIITSVIGTITRVDLSKFSGLALIALTGLIVTTLFNYFFFWINPGAAYASSWIITYAGVGLFIVLLAIDSQELKRLSYQIDSNPNSSATNLAVIGALGLYLNFINIFLGLLRIFSRARR